MKLTVFQSDKGDCLLLSAGQNSEKVHVLIDGGMAASYTEHASRKLSSLPQLDLVYVSHIDEDHISGVLRLVDDAFDWRVFNFRQEKGVAHPRPKSSEPPPIRRIWHNAFHDQVKKNSGAIEDIAIATASMAAAAPDLQELALEYQNLANSVPQAIQLSQRISSKQLGVRHNEGKGKLLMAGAGQKPIRIGPMTFTIIGPFSDELRELRKEWNAWLEANDERVRKMRARAASDAKNILVASVDDIESHLSARTTDLGDRARVTVPNLASLMTLVEEGSRSLLLTGDGHWETILRGLERTKKMAKGGTLHVNVLKVQHHGAEFNLSEEFCRRVTADHYVFCGNGAHSNPDLRVIDAIIASRAGGKKKFKLWFNSHHTVTKPRYKAHMEEVEALVRRHATKHGDKLQFEFLTEGAFRPITV